MQLAPSVQPEALDLQVLWDPLEEPAPLAQSDQLVAPALQAQPEIPAQQDPPEILDLQALLAALDLQETLDSLDLKVILERLVRPVQREILETQDLLGLLDLLV